jgi:hypothetical protein
MTEAVGADCTVCWPSTIRTGSIERQAATGTLREIRGILPDWEHSR